MKPHDDLAISVTADWNDWHSANARLGDLRDVHWHQPKGAPQPLIHAYVSPSDASTGHRVCVLRSHNIPDVYAELARRADQARGW